MANSIEFYNSTHFLFGLQEGENARGIVHSFEGRLNTPLQWARLIRVANAIDENPFMEVYASDPSLAEEPMEWIDNNIDHKIASPLYVAISDNRYIEFDPRLVERNLNTYRLAELVGVYTLEMLSRISGLEAGFGEFLILDGEVYSVGPESMDASTFQKMTKLLEAGDQDFDHDLLESITFRPKLELLEGDRAEEVMKIIM